jgi:hypothetical protein
MPNPSKTFGDLTVSSCCCSGCRGGEHSGSLVQHFLLSSLCGSSLLPAMVPQEVLQDKETFVAEARCKCPVQRQVALTQSVNLL